MKFKERITFKNLDYDYLIMILEKYLELCDSGEKKKVTNLMNRMRNAYEQV